MSGLLVAPQTSANKRGGQVSLGGDVQCTRRVPARLLWWEKRARSRAPARASLRGAALSNEPEPPPSAVFHRYVTNWEPQQLPDKAVMSRGATRGVKTEPGVKLGLILPRSCRDKSRNP